LIAGRLNRLFTFQRKEVTLNNSGNETETYADLFTAWCSIQIMRGKESTEGDEVVASNFYIIKARYDSRLKPKDRAVWDGNNYDIVSVAQLGYREGLEIMAKYKDNAQ
jgi:SPP1 family predicted phage head-tail adaptor